MTEPQEPEERPGSDGAQEADEPTPAPDGASSGRWLTTGWRRWALAAATLVLALIIAAVIVVLVRKPHNVSHPNLSFTATTATTTTPKPTATLADHFSWPYYGYTAGRTRDFTGAANLHPPFRRGWTHPGNALLEFPPAIYGHNLYFMDDSATVKDIDTVTGHLVWFKRVGTLSAASPALADKAQILVVPTLSDDSSSPGDGQIVALSMKTGHILWHHGVAAGTESSPIIHGDTVYLGSQSGLVYALNIHTGHVDWTFQASAAVKGGLAMDGNGLYLDDYGGHVYKISARTGHQIWQASSDGGDLGFSSGTFYSTPTVAFGRVYVGNTSGYVYSFAAGSGQLAWSYGTGSYVYASAAVADVPHVGPTVFMGSYNGDFYAFNAQSGAVRWVHEDARHDAISGSATVVDDVVYYSDLHDKLTTGLDAATGKSEFSFHDGAFSPVVADDDHIYLSGGYTLYELLPKDPLPGATTAKRSTKTTKTTKTTVKRTTKAAARHSAKQRPAKKR